MSVRLDRRTTLRAVAATLFAAALPGCSGQQSALDPKGPDAAMVADLGWWMFAVAAVVLAAVLAVLAAGLRRRARPIGERGRTAVVVLGGIVAPLAAIFALTVSGVLIGRATTLPRDADALVVEVRGERWWWEVRYPDGPGGEPVVTANEIHIPVGRPVRIRLISDNVIHSFWVPNLQGKTDLIPGLTNETRLVAGEPGVYRGQCAEFCGVQHALMGFVVVAEPEADFAAWLAAQARPATPPAELLLARGAETFGTAGCGRCHTVRGTAAAGERGPDLTHLASRRTLAAATLPNSRGNLGGWISDPQHVKPGSLMPGFALQPADLHALVAWLESLR
ncbi:cytochrome c oxidase subunit II [Azospirillum sp. ST 5-10]|uniref:cytochrome c oxidase subunit II n=1 Tax=unclassified Azospirillum TaxID=2630922 RepID=UPI003F4A5069